MRITYVINSVEGGGAQSPLPHIVGALEKAGAKVTVLALARRNGKAIALLERHGIRFEVREGEEGDHLAALRWIVARAREHSSDVLWTSLTRATLLGQIAGQRLLLPVVSWQHNAFLKPWNERLLRLRSSASDLWIADSDDVAQLTARRMRVAQTRLMTWPIFAADPAAPVARPALRGERLRIGSLGRLHPNKGYDVLIEALRLMVRQDPVIAGRVSFAIAGIGEEEDSLRQKATALGVADLIQFVRHIDDPAAFLAACHAYVQPSRREGFCIAAHEAMQAGLALVVSRTGQMPRTVTAADAGLVVEPKEPEELAAALIELARDDTRRAVWGANARRHVLSQYSKDRFDAIGAEIVSRIASLPIRR